MEARPDPMPILAALLLAQGEAGPPERLFAALDDALGRAVGHRLCSIQRHDPARMEAVRVHSSQPSLYPVGARKRVADAPRMRQLIEDGTQVLVRDAAEFRRSYPDGGGMAGLGCGAAVNTPVRWQGRTLGQVNLMHREGWYTEADLVTIAAFAQALVPAFLTMPPA